MGISVGTRLGPYEILAPIGAGGMGEVYRAHDTRLKRDVALKVLPDSFANDPERMARFHREAEVLAALNHPNIAQIFGVEERTLIMELVEGEAPKGPMPFDDAWCIASQIAAALEYAHERGIIHRDLKPANIKITPDGVVKLLDFGLAKAFTNQKEPSANAENSPTLTMGATEVGMILGTAAYMSPEQARGKSVDKRGDIWAFGVILYELLTGERLFKGEDVADTLAQVLTKEPDVERAPAKARRLLQSCLERDPKRRLRDVGDAWRQVEETPQNATETRATVPWAATALLAVITATISFVLFREKPPAKTVLRYTISPPEQTTDLHSFAISPDGRLLAMAATVNGKRQLWVRPMDSLQAQVLPGTDDATYPFWSHDSIKIGFFARGKLKTIDATGGATRSLCNSPGGSGGSWSRDNVILFYPGSAVGSAIQRVSADGGAPSDVIGNKGASVFPTFLPDGRHFLYAVMSLSADRDGVYASSLDGKENRRIIPDVSNAAFAAGHLLFIRENTLMAQVFDPVHALARGEAFPIAEVASEGPSFTVSETGLLLYRGGSIFGPNQLAWVDRRGKLLGTVGAPGMVFAPAISPDGRSLLYNRSLPSESILWLWDLLRGTERRLTTVVSINGTPFWSPTGDRVTFSSNRGGGVFNLYQKGVSGTGQDELLFANGNYKAPTQWSHDGAFVVYSERDPKTKWDIWLLPMDADAERKPKTFLHSGFDELHGQISPDGRWMAYTSDETGRREVYVRAFPSGENQRRISLAGGDQPRWKGDNKELFFVASDGEMMTVPVQATPGLKQPFEPGVPQPLFQAYLAHQPLDAIFGYDVTGDGKRFLLDTVGVGSGSAPVLNVVLNWGGGLKK